MRTSVIYDLDVRVRFFNYVVENLKNNKKIKVTNDVFNSVTLIDSLINSIFSVIEKDKTGIFHTVDSTCVNRFDFSKCIAKIFNFDEKLIQETSINDMNVVARRPQNACLNHPKAKKELDVKSRTLEEGIKHILTKSNQK